MEATPSLNTCTNCPVPTPRTSQLCKPLAAILKDSAGALSMLEYFVQYMEEQDALHLLQFWFAVESFKIAAPSPKHATDLYSRELTTSSTNAASNDKQCMVNTASVETSASGHMTRHTVSCEEGSADPECNTVDVVLPLYPNPTQVNDDHPASNTNKGTRHCITNNIEGRKSMCGANSDTLEGKGLGDPVPAINSHSPTNDGVHVHGRSLLKQLSLGKEPYVWWFQRL